MTACRDLAPEVGTAAACGSLDLARATYYRWLKPEACGASETNIGVTPARALSREDRQEVLDVLHTERFVDRAPAEIYAWLLDEGKYLCSIRTMYRILGSEAEVRERRDQLRHPHYKAPELLATAPKQVWSWDITKLLGPVKWSYFYLYVILDIFSRYVVGWMIAHRESAALAERLIGETCRKEGILPGQLTMHADRGSSMTSKPVALLLADFGVTKTHSRPYVSNDNPYSESQFKTLKNRPEFPERFGSIEDARGFCREFFLWYNQEHRHTGIGLMTPAAVHYRLADQITRQRQQALAVAFRDHPERFVRGIPRPPEVPEAAWINKPKMASNRFELAATPDKIAVLGHGPSEDRRSWGLSEDLFFEPVLQVTGNDTKFDREVSQNR